MNLKVISINAGRKLSDQDAWDCFLHDCHLSHPDWGVIYISECDGFGDHDRQIYSGEHFVRRHWAGLALFRFAWLFIIEFESFYGPFRRKGGL